MKTRQTQSQERILNLLKVLNRPLSAQEMYVELRTHRQTMGLATVYRALEALKLEGVVQDRKLSNGESLYSLVQQDRHHSTCLQCGESIVIEDCPVHQLESQLQTEHQFKVYYHTLEFFGLCDDCQVSQKVVD
jgi:Fur family ferric uptake transcriptional regulator